MSNETNSIFDGLAKLATDAAGATQGIRQEVESVLRAQVEQVVNKLDLVNKEQHEALKALAAKALEENEILQKRVKTLEDKLNITS